MPGAVKRPSRSSRGRRVHRAAPQKSKRRNPVDGVLNVLKVLGPGLITGASDDDPSGIGTYSQAGSQFGYGVLWTAIFTFPLMLAVQEACARIALQTGVGLGVSLRRKFPTSLVGACIVALFLANMINVGADLGAVAAAGSLLTRGHVNPAWFLLPIAVVILVLQFELSYKVIFRLFKFLTLALFAYVVTVIVSHPPLLKTIESTFIPHIEFNAGFIGIIVAILGTTISPYLFFWQASSEVDEMVDRGLDTEVERQGVSRQEMHDARVDVLVGMGYSQLVMFSIILTGAAVLHASGHTNVATAAQAAQALQPVAGPFAFILFSVGIIGTGLLAIPILSGSATYAVKEFFGMKGTLADKARSRPAFYAVLTLALAGGLVISLLGIDPIKALVFTAIINGIVAPPMLALIALLGRDRKVMKEQTSGALSNTLLWITTGVMTIAALALLVTSL
jgi:NRAMP (natural resistance-associated macrophage protein)-like metal ion transporter